MPSNANGRSVPRAGGVGSAGRAVHSNAWPGYDARLQFSASKCCALASHYRSRFLEDHTISLGDQAASSCAIRSPSIAAKQEGQMSGVSMLPAAVRPRRARRRGCPTTPCIDVKQIRGGLLHVTASTARPTPAHHSQPTAPVRSPAALTACGTASLLEPCDGAAKWPTPPSRAESWARFASFHRGKIGHRCR